MPRKYKPSEFISAMLHSSGVYLRGNRKTCNKCLTEKDIEDFSRNVRSPDGRVHTCKECCKTKAHGLYRNKKRENDFLKSMLPI